MREDARGARGGVPLDERTRRLLAACSACALGVIALAALAYHVAPVAHLDARALAATATPRGSTVNRVALFTQRPVSPLSQVVATALACAIALARGRPLRGALAIALVAGAEAIIELLKLALTDPRYHALTTDQLAAGVHPTANSFPSGNSGGALALALAFLLVTPRAWRGALVAVGVVFTVIVSAGLLALNYHYPSDIVGGWLVTGGWCCALLAPRGVRGRGGGVAPLAAARAP